LTTAIAAKAALYRSLGAFAIVPPVVAAAVTFKVVEKSFKPYIKKR